MFECRIRSKEFPEEGEIVMVRISLINDDIVTAVLLEYGEIEGLIMSGELSKKKYRSIHQVTKVGNAELCQVQKVDKQKGYIDLSLKRVGDKERSEGKDSFARSKLAYQMMQKVSKIVNIPVKELYEKYGYRKEEEFGTLFSFFSKLKDSPELVGDDDVLLAFRKVSEETFKSASYKARVDVDVSTIFGGVDAIKEAFGCALEFDDTLEITLVKSPTYSILKNSDNKEKAFESLNRACDLVKESIESRGGEFSISSPVKVYGEKNKSFMCEDEEPADCIEDSDDSDDDSE